LSQVRRGRATTSLLLIGGASILLDNTAALPYVVITLTVMFMAFMQGAVGPVTWLVISEIFPIRVRGLGVGISVFCLWIANFIIGLTFPVLLGAVGLSTTFFIFVALGILSITFIYKYMPETRGKTLEELERSFRAASNPQPAKLRTVEVKNH